MQSINPPVASLTIEIPERYNPDLRKFKPIHIVFDSEAEQHEYVKNEARYCADAKEGVWTAPIAKEARVAARERLYARQHEFFTLWKNNKQASQPADGAPEVA